MRSTGSWRASVFLLAMLASMTATAAATDIALLLPQSGRLAKAAEAIRDGFLAAYYQDAGSQAEPPTLHFYDSDSGPILALVQKAKADGAQIVVGPLDRERLDVLAKEASLPLPVLALNSAERTTEGLFQFALAPEDEILRLVEWMRQQDIKKPLLLASADEASQRHLRIFQSLWSGSTGPQLPVTTLDPARKGGITVTIRDLVKDTRKNDALFLATPSLARQVQPALTYYHSSLPLYSLASAWDPTADASGQRDLDGLRICDLPWMVSQAEDAAQETLYATLGRPGGGFDRLHAFGADAWTLVRQWDTLQESFPLALRTGVVQADALRRLRRTPTCAEIRNGNASPLWSPEADTTGTGRRR
ncbi:MAG: hypothetical protein K0S46_249 [Moraxellaceae bacterium]|jgi:outer membrane PBP1 activator LpoA protein|nr:hypothetical protein [Moraxellaceae bacterium]